ncbi:acyltransferase [Candidatus Latescibacterota bacterium]
MAVVVADEIEMCQGAEVKPMAVIWASAKLHLGAFSVISYGTVIHGGSDFTLGARSHVGFGCLVDLTAPVSIGEFVALGPRVVIMTHASHRPASWGYPNSRGPVRIGDLVSIGFCCRVGHGVRIVRDVQLVPGSIVLRDVEKAGIVYDSPLRRVCVPESVSRKLEITEDDVRDVVRRAVEMWNQDGPEAWSLEMQHDGTRLVSSGRRQRVVVHLFGLHGDRSPRDRHYLFGYDISDEAFEAASDYQVLDFTRLLYSSNADKQLLAMARFFQGRLGCRFVDYECHQELVVASPEIQRQ